MGFDYCFLRVSGFSKNQTPCVVPEDLRDSLEGSGWVYSEFIPDDIRTAADGIGYIHVRDLLLPDLDESSNVKKFKQLVEWFLEQDLDVVFHWF